jgi:hypothetical protein
MAPYNPFLPCPKCGEPDVLVEFHHVHHGDPRCFGAGLLEHLRRKCPKCGYWWVEATIGSKPSFPHDESHRIGQPEPGAGPLVAPPHDLNVKLLNVKFLQGRLSVATKEKNLLAGLLLAECDILLGESEIVFVLTEPFFSQSHIENLEMPRWRGAVEEAVRETFGRDLAVKFSLKRQLVEPPQEPEATMPEAPEVSLSVKFFRDRLSSAVKQKNASAGTLLAECDIILLPSRIIFVLPSPRFSRFHVEQLETSQHRSAVEEAVRGTFGPDMGVEFVLVGTTPPFGSFKEPGTKHSQAASVPVPVHKAEEGDRLTDLGALVREGKILRDLLVSAVKEKNQLAGALIAECEVILLGEKLSFALPSPRFSRFHVEQLETPRFRSAIEEAVRRVFGRNLDVKFCLKRPLFEFPKEPGAEQSQAASVPVPFRDADWKSKGRKGKPGRKSAKKRVKPHHGRSFKEAAKAPQTPPEQAVPPAMEVPAPAPPALSAPPAVSKALDVLKGKGGKS